MTYPTMLYRVIADLGPEHNSDEYVVFFDIDHAQPVHPQIETILRTVIPGCRADFPSGLLYNLDSEPELIRTAFGAPSTGDLRLLETGWNKGRPHYADPNTVLLYTGPVSTRRLHAALQQLESLPPAIPAQP